MSYQIKITDEDGNTLVNLHLSKSLTFKMLIGLIPQEEEGEEVVGLAETRTTIKLGKKKEKSGGGADTKGRLTELDKMDIKEKLADGEKVKDIAAEYEVNPVTIYALKKKFENNL